MDGTEVESSAGCLGCFTVPLGDIRSCPRPPKQLNVYRLSESACYHPIHPFPPNHLIEFILVNILTLEMGEKQNM